MILIKVSNFERKLKDIPCPSPPHLAVLNDLVERIYAEKGLSEEEVRYRSDLTKALEDKLTKDEHLKGKVLKSVCLLINGLNPFLQQTSLFQIVWKICMQYD